ncbi:MAG: Fic family protein [Candidatus Omnitrophota bacterium]
MFKAGIYKKHFFKKDYKYESFTPSSINTKLEWKDKNITVSLEEAVKFLGELNSYSNFIPDIDFFIKMHVLKEATTSSKIEGTQTGIEEAILPESQILPEKRDDWEEVHNYIKAMWHAIEQLKELPLCIRLIKNAHKTLLSGVRGQEKQPGKIRKTQNWIGGSSLKDAFFIPPHPEEVPALLSDLEKFWHNDALSLPILIKTALTHYQFETIHPFLDGNGRIGRLLITLQLIYNNVLSLPTLYISDFFEKNRGAYYDSLNMVRSSSDIEQWIKFFLSAVTETSKKGIATFKSIITLREKYENVIDTLGRRRNLAKKLLLYMFSNPITNINQASKELDVVFNTANTLIQELLKKGILERKDPSKRNQFFILKEYLDLFKK